MPNFLRHSSQLMNLSRSATRISFRRSRMEKVVDPQGDKVRRAAERFPSAARTTTRNSSGTVGHPTRALPLIPHRSATFGEGKNNIHGLGQFNVKLAGAQESQQGQSVQALCETLLLEHGPQLMYLRILFGGRVARVTILRLRCDGREVVVIVLGIGGQLLLGRGRHFDRDGGRMREGGKDKEWKRRKEEKGRESHQGGRG